MNRKIKANAAEAIKRVDEAFEEIIEDPNFDDPYGKIIDLLIEKAKEDMETFANEGDGDLKDKAKDFEKGIIYLKQASKYLFI